jgi:hypothetical protein
MAFRHHQINDQEEGATTSVQHDVRLRSTGDIGHDRHVQPKDVWTNLIQRPCSAQRMFGAGPRFERAGDDSKAHPSFRGKQCDDNLVGAPPLQARQFPHVAVSNWWPCHSAAWCVANRASPSTVCCP